MRYRSGEHADGLPAGEAAFLACSFWLVDALAAVRRADEAAELFDRLLGLRKDLGLLAEGYDPRERRMLGNFPEAFSHIPLANSASACEQRLQPLARATNASAGALSAEKDSAVAT